MLEHPKLSTPWAVSSASAVAILRTERPACPEPDWPGHSPETAPPYHPRATSLHLRAATLANASRRSRSLYRRTAPSMSCSLVRTFGDTSLPKPDVKTGMIQLALPQSYGLRKRLAECPRYPLRAPVMPRSAAPSSRTRSAVARRRAPTSLPEAPRCRRPYRSGISPANVRGKTMS